MNEAAERPIPASVSHATSKTRQRNAVITHPTPMAQRTEKMADINYAPANRRTAPMRLKPRPMRRASL